jgi:YesN/AraC family two-component response regulator
MVDDEEDIRRDFQKKINWENWGFQFLEPCENGKQAIECIAKYQPDVVITDICMPIVNGLEVAAYVSENHPGITVVILSECDNFEYARSAIRSRVFDYVLKPITSFTLQNLLVELKKKLDNDRKHQSESKYYQEADSLKQCYEQTLDKIKIKCWNFSEKKALEAKEFVDMHYQDIGLSIEKVCNKLSISASYLSRIFKKYIGRTFIEYLTEFRIEKAKELLKNTDLKNYAVAEMVGYTDPHYFCNLFKRITGLTPSEYRNQ